MNKLDFIRVAAQDRIKSAVDTLKIKHNGKNAITSEALTGIYFELHPGVDELNSDYADLCSVANSLDVDIIHMADLNESSDETYRFV